MELEKSYRVLGVSSESDQAEIKSAFRRLAIEYHPDRNKNPEAVAKFADINEAYRVITNAHPVADFGRPLYADRDSFDGGFSGELSFAIMTNKEVVHRASAAEFEKEVRRYFNQKSVSGTYCRIGERWFEIGHEANSGTSLFRWGSAKRETLTEWYRAPNGTDKWKPIKWDGFWSYVRQFSSFSVAETEQKTTNPSPQK